MLVKKKAVVVDDDLKIVMMVEKALTGIGFEVFQAENGIKALELVKRERPDLLITDILIPGIDGIKLCKRVKEELDEDNIKVIIITGVFNESNFRLEMDCNADAFIAKPLDIKKLVQLVETTIIGNNRMNPIQ